MNTHPLADSHCHVHLMELNEPDSVLAVLQRAKANGVAHLLCVATELGEVSTLQEYCEAYPDFNMRFSVGIHPNHAPKEVFKAAQLLTLMNDPKCVAVGETGLDYFRSEGDLPWQRERFVMHIDVAKETEKPLIIHTRAAQADTISILKSESARDVGGVMHCFTEDWAMAKQAMDLGFYISISGIVTFKNAVALQEVALKIPLSRLLIETDSPYLAPIPHRGQQNEPAFVKHVAEFIAQLKGVSVDEIAKVTTDNFLTLFKV